MSRGKSKISQKVIQKVIVKIGDIKKKRRARRKVRKQIKDDEGTSKFQQMPSIIPNVTYLTQPTQFTPYIPKQFEDIYNTLKGYVDKKEEEKVINFPDLRPIAEPLKVPTKEILDEKDVVITDIKPKTNLDASNPNPYLIYNDTIKDKNIDYDLVGNLNTFSQEELNRNDDLYSTKPKIINTNFAEELKKQEEIIFKRKAPEKPLPERLQKISDIDKITKAKLLALYRDKRGIVPTKIRNMKKDELIIELKKITGEIPSEKITSIETNYMY